MKKLLSIALIFQVLISSVQGLDGVFTDSNKVITKPAHIPSGTYLIADVEEASEHFRESSRMDGSLGAYSLSIDNYFFHHPSVLADIKIIQSVHFELRIFLRKLPKKLFLGFRSLLI